MQITIFFFQEKVEQNISLKVIWGIGIGTGINTGNVVDLANLDLVDIDILSPDEGSRLQPRPRTRLDNPTPNPTR